MVGEIGWRKSCEKLNTTMQQSRSGLGEGRPLPMELTEPFLQIHIRSNWSSNAYGHQLQGPPPTRPQPGKVSARASVGEKDLDEIYTSSRKLYIIQQDETTYLTPSSTERKKTLRNPSLVSNPFLRA